jgi:hypothetical protein
MSLPDRVLNAVSAHRASMGVISAGPVQRGDIRRVHPLSTSEGERRICLVLRVDRHRESAEVMLGHPTPELATDSDVVLRSDATGLGYPIVFQTEVRGVVWLTQIDCLVGRVEAQTLKQIGGVALGDPVPLGIEVGLALGGAMDHRWGFKVYEGEAMATLAADCTGALIDGQSPWQLDPGLFSPELLSETPDVDALIIDLMHTLSTRIVQFDLEDVEILDRLGALSLDRWMSTFGHDIGRSFFEALQPLINHALATASSPRQAPEGFSAMTWRPERPGNAAIAMPAPRLQRLITASHLWVGDEEAIQQVLMIDGEEHERSVDVLLVGPARAR